MNEHAELIDKPTPHLAPARQLSVRAFVHNGQPGWLLEWEVEMELPNGSRIRQPQQRWVIARREGVGMPPDMIGEAAVSACLRLQEATRDLEAALEALSHAREEAASLRAELEKRRRPPAKKG
jgi:hypothetical protein